MLNFDVFLWAGDGRECVCVGGGGFLGQGVEIQWNVNYEAINVNVYHLKRFFLDFWQVIGKQGSLDSHCYK